MFFHPEQECLSLTGKQSAMEGDAWVISFLEAENRLLIGGCRRKCLSILKTLRDQVWMDYKGSSLKD